MTEVKFIVLLWTCCCYCVVIVLTAESVSAMHLTVSDVSFHEKDYQPCNKSKQYQAWALHVLATSILDHCSIDLIPNMLLS